MKGLFFVLGLFFAMGFVFALPVLNVQGRILNGGNPVSSGSVTASVFASSTCSGTALFSGQDTSLTNGIFDVTLNYPSGLLASNTPYYLRLVYGSVTLVSCQAFYPTQVQGGTVVPLNANATSKLVVGDFKGDFWANYYYNQYSPISVLNGHSIFGYPYNNGTFSWFRNNVFVWDLNLPVGDSNQPSLNAYGALNVYGSIYSPGANPVRIGDDLSVSGSGGLTVSGAGGVKTNSVSTTATTGANDLTLQVGQSGKAVVKKGSGVAQEVCLKDGTGCPSGGGVDNVNYVVKPSGYGTQTVNNPVAVLNNFAVGSSSTPRTSTFNGDVVLSGTGSELVANAIKYPNVAVPGSSFPKANAVSLWGQQGVAVFLNSYLPFTVQTGTTVMFKVQEASTNVPEITIGAAGVASKLTLLNTLISAQGASAVNIDDSLDVSGDAAVDGRLTVGGSNGLNVLNGPLTVGSGTGGSASVGSLAVRSSSATVNGKDVCLEDGTNCKAQTDYSVKYVSRFLETRSGSSSPVTFNYFQIGEFIGVDRNDLQFYVLDFQNVYDKPPLCIARCNDGSGSDTCSDFGFVIGVGPLVDVTPACPGDYPVLKGCSYTDEMCGGSIGLINCPNTMGRVVTSLCGKV